jgi:hypothetical protein
LFEQAKASRVPSYDSDASAKAKQVGLTDDDADDSQVALSLVEQMYPSASRDTKAAHFVTALGQLQLQRRRRAGRAAGRRAVELSAIDNLARRMGQVPPSAIAAAVKRAGFRTQGDPPAAGTRGGGTLGTAEIRRACQAAGLAV